MGRLAVVLGSNALGPGGRDLGAEIETHGALALQRHRGEAYRLPHLIDHEANLRPLLDAGCDRVLAICSVGSLDEGLPTGSFLCPSDFIALGATATIFDDARAHATPGFDRAWRARLLSAWERELPGTLRDGGVYWQTVGPRFETPAEIRLISPHADVVGMTIAAECVVAAELGLSYAAICAVDNLANGVGDRPVDVVELDAARAANALLLHDGLAAVLPQLGAVGP